MKVKVKSQLDNIEREFEIMKLHLKDLPKTATNKGVIIGMQLAINRINELKGEQ